ncbi:MAG: thioredoxin-dependent thiol peroxidase [Bacteriovoracaceae bacterium]|nr:thioredoxin-dependent thiol peroxidase [Bacteriovoracaceae bacterium]
MEKELKLGSKAPTFKLKNQDDEWVSLKDFLGKKVVVYFYPKALTPGCTKQACGLRDSKVKLSKKNVVVLGISADPVEKLKKFSEKEKLKFDLLSDPENEIAKKYHSYGPKKFMGRSYEGILRQTYLIDEAGKIIQVMSKVNTSTHHDDVLDLI